MTCQYLKTKNENSRAPATKMMSMRVLLGVASYLPPEHLISKMLRLDEL